MVLAEYGVVVVVLTVVVLTAVQNELKSNQNFKINLSSEIKIHFLTYCGSCYDSIFDLALAVFEINFTLRVMLAPLNIGRL